MFLLNINEQVGAIAQLVECLPRVLGFHPVPHKPDMVANACILGELEVGKLEVKCSLHRVCEANPVWKKDK